MSVSLSVIDLPIYSKHVEENTWDFHNSIQEEVQVHVASHCSGSQKKAVVGQTVHKPVKNTALTQ